MDNSILVPQKEGLPTAVAKEGIVQTGEKSVFAASVNNLNVTQNIYVSNNECKAISKNDTTVIKIAEKQTVQQNFEIDKELNDNFFNLFIVANDTDFEKKHFNIGKCYSVKSGYNTDDVIKRFGELDSKALKALETLPCLFTTMCQHINYKKINSDIRVHLGKITRIDTLSESFRIHFEIETSFPIEDLVRLHEEFDIRCDWNGFGELTSIHWAVKNVNLMYELNLAGVLTST